MFKSKREVTSIYIAIIAFFGLLLLLPLATLIFQAFQTDQGFSLANFQTILGSSEFYQSLGNSLVVSTVSGLLAVFLAFLLAYTVNFTRIKPKIKKVIRLSAVLPMLLPTITYGFAIIYAYGKQGLATKIVGGQLFDIYGFNGLVIGYVIYTLPIAFLLIDNTMKYIDKKFLIVSNVMGDSAFAQLKQAILIPLTTTFVTAFVQAFFLAFTDFGIPASVGGEYPVVSILLYNQMLGTLPNFSQGAVIAIAMVLPAIFSLWLLNYIKRFNVRYQKISKIELAKNKSRDILFAIFSGGILLNLLFVLGTILLVPFVKNWPYNLAFTTEHLTKVLATGQLVATYRNSLVVSFGTAFLGTIIAYFAALLATRSQLSAGKKTSLSGLMNVTNAMPGMVLGIAFLLAFSGTPMHYTLVILVLCNLIHFFATPFNLAQGALDKMNGNLESTATLMGDSWFKTIWRVVLPNTRQTLLEMFAYYFVNSMVTISAVIFLVGANTSVLTTKIAELQHFNEFSQIFILSLIILGTNVLVKGLVYWTAVTEKRGATKNSKFKYSLVVVGFLLLFLGSSVIGNAQKKVIIYSNADEEAIEVMRDTLDNNGYKDQYLIQSLGTNELGGRVMVEGKTIEADILTLSSYYLDSGESKNQMFQPLNNPLIPNEPSSYAQPLIGLEGTLIINPQVLKENKLTPPKSFKELADSRYQGLVSIPDIRGSSTGWLLVQALIDTYGETEGRVLLSKIIKNSGPHLEQSGSGPLKKVRSGEVAIAFGLRHQAIKDKAAGLPVDFIDPTEGNYVLKEAIARVDHGKNELADQMVATLLNKGRKAIFAIYQTPIYPGEVSPAAQEAAPKEFPEKLTVSLLEKHQKLFEESEQLK